MACSGSSTPSSSYPLLSPSPSYTPLYPLPSHPHPKGPSQSSTHLPCTLAAIEDEKKPDRQSSALDIISMSWEAFLKCLNDYDAAYTGSNSVVRTSAHSSRVFKVAAGRDKRPQLANEAYIHQHILTAFEVAPASVKDCVLIPKLYSPQLSTIRKKLNCIMKRFRAPAPVSQAFGILMERIRPVPRNLSEWLGREHQMVQGNRTLTKHSCLISIFLGCEHAALISQHHTPATELLLTRHELHEEELPLRKYVHALADALAILHWQASVDGYGIKFVLGRPRQKHIWPIQHLADDFLGPYETLIQEKHHDPDEPHKTLALWMFDFTQCQKIEHTEECVFHLVNCYWEAAPWFPRPFTSEGVDAQWGVFSARYIATASMFVSSALPEFFISAIEKDSSM